ncbi:MAG TPA: ATP-binding protein [Geobacteraceae bacterium]
MNNDKKATTETAELRRHAEERLRAKTAERHPPRTEEETQRLVHELQVHQIELEMQNEELRQARDEREALLEKYTDLYDLAPVGYVTLDRDGAVRAVNLTGASLLGMERSQVIGRRFGQFVQANARTLFSEFLGKVFASQDKETCELALLKGGKNSCFVQMEAVAAASGQECRAAMIDISVRRQLEEQLEILHTNLANHAADLEAANIELEAFNFTASHDMRGPLTTIHGYCQVLQELCGDQLDEHAREYIQGIKEGTLRMNRLISTLLRFSRVTRAEICRETVDLSAMAKAVAAELQLTAPERRVTFQIAEGIMANGDAGLLRVVLDNLIRNAWKYTGNQEVAVIEFDVSKVNGKPACLVRDNGPGFDMAHAGKLFVPFHRLPGSDFEGHGIGLATVDRIIRRHGGRVWAESEPGKGATIFFTME